MFDSALLYDVNLLALASSLLHGTWRIRCVLPGDQAERTWAEATHVRFAPEALHLLHPKAGELAGTWQLQRHMQLGQPFLVLHLPGAATQALITRLRCSPDGILRQMVVYFPSGLELDLTHP